MSNPLPFVSIDSLTYKGLSQKQASAQKEAGFDNVALPFPGKSHGQIVFSHVFTFFN
ncbi:MAG: hypothetical protein GX786_10155, partial [Clostridiales bacterium]|nr:hypothetical protein [Clostridiales bacterium]